MQFFLLFLYVDLINMYKSKIPPS